MSDFETRLAPIYDDLWRYARAMCGNAADTDDLMQDTLIKAFKGYERLRDEDRFEAWLFQIMRNTHRSRESRNRLKHWVTLEALTSPPSEDLLHLDDQDLIHHALASLPRLQREAVVLADVMGYSIKEIMEAQRAGESAVKTRLSRARAGLHNWYKTLEKEEKRYEAKQRTAGGARLSELGA